MAETTTTTDALSVRGLFDRPPRYTARSPWGPITAAFATAAVFAGQLLGVFAATLAISAGTGWMDGGLTDEAYLALSSPVGLSLAIASQLASIALVWAFAGRAAMRKDVLQLSGPAPGWGLCLFAGLIVIVVTGLLELVLYRGLGYDIFGDTRWLADGLRSPYWWGTLIVAVALAPLWEELTFRGFLLSALAQTRLGFWGSALAVNTVWTALHATYSLPGIVSVFVAGLLLCWLLWRTGSIWVPIAAHAVANLVAVGFAYVFAPA